MVPEEAGEIKLVAEFQFEGDFPYGAVRPGKKTGCPVDKKTVEKLFRRNSGIPDEILDEGLFVHPQNVRHLSHVDSRMAVVKKKFKERFIAGIGGEKIVVLQFRCRIQGTEE